MLTWSQSVIIYRLGSRPVITENRTVILPIICCDPMELNRRFYTHADLQASPEAMAIMDGLQRTTRKVLERYASLSPRNLEFMLVAMNKGGTDFGHRFVYLEYFGGLCHVQHSHLAGDDFLLLMPRSPEFPSRKAINRVAMQSNGVMVTVAPEAVSAMWRVAMENNSVRIHLGESVPFTMAYTRTCANCLKSSDALVHCTCEMLRYCGRKCQKAHWRLGHKELCEWTRSCLEAFGPNQIEE